MNDNNTLENASNENINKVKIDYVNPLNANEVLNSKNAVEQPVAPEPVQVQPIEPVQPVAQPVQQVSEPIPEPVPELGQQPIEPVATPTPTPGPAPVEKEETTISIKHKGKGMVLMFIVVIIALAIILCSILVIPKLFNKEEEPTVDTPPVQEQEEDKIGLDEIIANATNSTYYKLLTSTYKVDISNTDKSIVFDLNNTDEENPINKQVTFDLKNRNLKVVFNNKEDNTDKLNILYAVLDSIGQYYGHEIDETGNYLYSIQKDYNFNVKGITTSEIDKNSDTFEITINIDTNINTSKLNSIYFDLDELNLYKENIINYSVNLKKGDQILSTSNDKVFTILIGQRKELNDNTYKAITNIIGLLYPEEIDDFKSKFTELSTISFDKYKITIDPKLNKKTFPQYQSNYKFIKIEISEQEEQA